MEKPNFTKQRGGKFYLISEVDTYIELLQKAYLDTQQEMEDLRLGEIESANDRLAAQMQEDEIKQELKRKNELLASEKKKLLQDVKRLEGQVKSLEDQSQTNQKDQSAEELQVARKLIADLQQELESEKQGQQVKAQQQKAQQDKIQQELDSTKQTLREKEQQMIEQQEKIQQVSVQHDPEGAQKYIDIYETARQAADSYVEQIEGLMNEQKIEADEATEKLRVESREKSIRVIQEAKEEAKEIVQTAMSSADKIEEEAKQKKEETEGLCEQMQEETKAKLQLTVEKAKEEYAQIRTLIETSSREYMELSKKNTELDAL